MTALPTARGMALLGPLKQLRAQFGAEAVAAALPGWGPELAAACASRVNKTDWYPYVAFVQLLEGAEREFGTGDLSLVSTLGEAAARTDLSGGAFSILRVLASPRHLISSCERVWPRYYDRAGRMIAIAREPEETVLRILDFPSMARAHCRMMEGWMISAMAQLGAKVLPGGRETQCVRDGGPYHEFRCQWTT